MYYLKNDLRSNCDVCLYLFWSLFLSFINYPLTLFLQVLATDFQSHPPAKPTHREALSSALPEPAQQTKGRWKIPGVPIWTLKWSFSVTQNCEICIFSFLRRAIELRQCSRCWWECGIEKSLENYSQQRMNLGRPCEGLRMVQMLLIKVPSTVRRSCLWKLHLQPLFCFLLIWFVNFHLGIGVVVRLHGFVSLLQILNESRP